MSCGSTCWIEGTPRLWMIARVSVARIVFGGLEGWDGGGFLPVLLVAFEQLFDQEGDGAFVLNGFADFGWRSEGA
jgi:hypothetical protein